jgi:hypothetical protein
MVARLEAKIKPNAFEGRGLSLTYGTADLYKLTDDADPHGWIAFMSEDWTFDDVCSVCFLMPHIADQFRSLMQQSGDVPRYISALQASWAGLQSMRIWSSFSLIPISFLP